MAKRKRKKSTSVRRRSLSAKPARRRRRRLGAGAGMFKMLSDPLIGGLVGAGAGIVLKHFASNMMKDKNNQPNMLIGTAVPLALAFFLRKKAPFAAASMAGAPAVIYLASLKKKDGTAMIPLLSEYDNVNFADVELLNDDSPLFLSANGQPLFLSDQNWSMNESEDEFTGMNDYNDDDDF